MKVVIITVPMKWSDKVEPILYPVDGNKTRPFEYHFVLAPVKNGER
jgi:hypothetical protein